jgi:5-methylcytosine-specific restriction endonuclease McrA
VLDHIIPINKGGDPWNSNNHQGMCESCHAIKSRSERA